MRGFQRRSLAIGMTALIAALAGLWLAPHAVPRAWLSAAVLWSAIPIGGVGLLMMMHLIPGVWDEEIMLEAEAAAMLVPLSALSFVPVLLWTDALYSWVGHDYHNAFRAAYLSEGFFIARTLTWFAALGTLALLLIKRRRWSSPVSAGGLILYTALGSTMAVDWLMSLDPEFHSSGFGLYVLSIQMTVALCAAIMLAVLAGQPLRRPEALGALMLSAMLLWAYFAFMQFFIIWSTNLPEPVRWYLHRGEGAWPSVFRAVVILHGVPALLLLLGPVRRHAASLAGFAAAILLGKALEIAWLVLPSGGQAHQVADGWLTAAAVVGLGGLFASAHAWAFERRVRARSPRDGHTASMSR